MAALVANAGISVAKFVGFLITGSASLLAEAVHSVADTSNQGLLLLGGKRATRAATAEHSFGFGRERYFWSFVVALVLFSMGGLFAIAGAHNLQRALALVAHVLRAIDIAEVAAAEEGENTEVQEAIAGVHCLVASGCGCGLVLSH